MDGKTLLRAHMVILSTKANVYYDKLKRVPYRIAAKPLDVSASREIGLALRSRKNAPIAVQRLLDYLQYR